jgi:hypothetical protein
MEIHKGAILDRLKINAFPCILITDCIFKKNFENSLLIGIIIIVLSRAKNSGRQRHFKIWLDCHKLKKMTCLVMPMSTMCQKNEKKITSNVIQHDDRL